jgi:hypothetical protein
LKIIDGSWVFTALISHIFVSYQFKPGKSVLTLERPWILYKKGPSTMNDIPVSSAWELVILACAWLTNYKNLSETTP